MLTNNRRILFPIKPMAPATLTISVWMIHRNLTLTLIPRTRKTVPSVHLADGIVVAGMLEETGALGPIPGRRISQTHSLRLRKARRTRRILAAHGRSAATRRTKKRLLLPTLTLETSAPSTKKRRKRQRRAKLELTMAGGPLAAARKTRRPRRRTHLKIQLATLSSRLSAPHLQILIL